MCSGAHVVRAAGAVAVAGSRCCSAGLLPSQHQQPQHRHTAPGAAENLERQSLKIFARLSSSTNFSLISILLQPLRNPRLRKTEKLSKVNLHISRSRLSRERE